MLISNLNSDNSDSNMRILDMSIEIDLSMAIDMKVTT